MDVPSWSKVPVFNKRLALQSQICHKSNTKGSGGDNREECASSAGFYFEATASICIDVPDIPCVFPPAGRYQPRVMDSGALTWVTLTFDNRVSPAFLHLMK